MVTSFDRIHHKAAEAKATHQARMAAQTRAVMEQRGDLGSLIESRCSAEWWRNVDLWDEYWLPKYADESAFTEQGVDTLVFQRLIGQCGGSAALQRERAVTVQSEYTDPDLPHYESGEFDLMNIMRSVVETVRQWQSPEREAQTAWIPTPRVWESDAPEPAWKRLAVASAAAESLARRYGMWSALDDDDEEMSLEDWFASMYVAPTEGEGEYA